MKTGTLNDQRLNVYSPICQYMYREIFQKMKKTSLDIANIFPNVATMPRGQISVHDNNDFSE